MGQFLTLTIDPFGHRFFLIISLTGNVGNYLSGGRNKKINKTTKFVQSTHKIKMQVTQSLFFLNFFVHNSSFLSQKIDLEVVLVLRSPICNMYITSTMELKLGETREKQSDKYILLKVI